MTPVSCFACAVAGAAACMDLRSARIPNRFILIALVLAIVLRSAQAGTVPKDAIIGAALPFALLFILFRFRMIGAGDIKLFCVLGALLGHRMILLCIVRSFLFGAVFSAGVLIARGDPAARLRYFLSYVRGVLAGGAIHPYRSGTFEPGANIHFTVPVLMAVLTLTGGVT